MSNEIEIRRFFEAYIQSKEGKITEQINDTVTVAYSEGTLEFTFQPAIAKEKKIPLLTKGSQAFQQILNESVANGILCQIVIRPKEKLETTVKNYFDDSPDACVNCQKTISTQKNICICTQTEPCHHKINNAKITSIRIIKNEPARFFQFYYVASFQNKLRAKNVETIPILLDKEGNYIDHEFDIVTLQDHETIKIQDFKAKLKPEVYDGLKALADQQLGTLLRAKVAHFELPIAAEKRARLQSFERRLRRERRERVISKKHDFDFQQWQTNYETSLTREKETYQTNINVKLLNLIVINTTKVKFEIALDNKANIQSTATLGLDTPEITCALCKKLITEGHATEDNTYVCYNCTHQSIDTGKSYSKKATLAQDETLNEYFERDKGFVCAVCGKRHSHLLEFKCSYDNSSICIYHYDVCDVCGKVFSKANLTFTDEFRRKVCPKHTKKET